MSFSTKVAAPPPPPAPVDPGQASLSFIQAMASPELQGQLFQAESTYRPQYTALNQRDLQNTLLGVAPGTEGGFYGTLDLADMAARRQAALQQSLQTQATEFGLAQLGAYGPAAREAYLGSNPQLAAAISQSEALGGRQSSSYLTEMARLAGQPSNQAPINPFAGTGVQSPVAQTGNYGTPQQQQQAALRDAQAAAGLQGITGAQTGAARPMDAGLLSQLRDAVSRAQQQPQMAQGGQLSAQPVGVGNVMANQVAAGAPVTPQQVGAGSVNAAQITSGGTLSPQQVTASMIGPVSSVGAQPVSANQIGPVGTLTPDRVSANLLGGVGTLTPQQVAFSRIASGGTLTPQQVAADQVAAERVASERVRAGQVQAGSVGAGLLGESLYQQALRGQEMSPVSSALQQQALRMAQGPGGITQEEARAATQGARERFASTGRLEDAAAITGEALARAGASRERQMQDLASAQQINQQLLGAQQMGQQLATDVLRTDIQRQQANIGTQLQAGQFNVDAMLRGDLANQQSALQANLANQDAFLRAQLANQQANLQANLANQQVGMQAGQFNITNAQDVQRLNQAAEIQAGLANQQAGMQAGQFNIGNQLAINQANQAAQNQFALANQQAGLQAGQFNIATTADLARLNQAANLQANLANQQAGLQAGDINARNQLAMQQANQAANLQAGMANQSTSLQAYLANQANQQRNYEFVTGTNLQTQLANRDFAAQQAQQRFANYGALLGSEQAMLGADRAYAGQLANQQAAVTAASLGLIGFGQLPASLQLGAQQQGISQSQMGMGPKLFDPNAGINLALQQAANLGNYQAATYGARAGAQGAIMGGLFQGLGQAAGGICWVAREVYGEDNPKWLMFREWLLTKAPDWFRNLYIKHGERFAAFLRTKPSLKRLIRKWMDSRIQTLALA